MGTGCFTQGGNSSEVLLGAIHPVPPAASPGGSITAWIWLTIVLALVVAAGLVLTSRR